MRAAAIALAILALVACGGGGGDSAARKVEQALVAGTADRKDARSNSRATSADCGQGAPAQVGDDEITMHECAAETPRGPLHLSCGTGFDEGPEVVCIESAPSVGTPVFTTPEQQLAPKEVTWKCEDVDSRGREVGPALIAIRDAPPGSPVEERAWMTKEEARALAGDLGAPLSVDC